MRRRPNRVFDANNSVEPCVVGKWRSVLFLLSFLVWPVLGGGCTGQGFGTIALDGPGVQERLWTGEGWKTSGTEDVRRAVVRESTVVIPTYPYEAYQVPALDARYDWPYQRFDRDRFLLDAPLPENRTYRLVILENDYLQVLVLPELGGRIWQVTHKASGNRMFYQNPVVKPSPWGPPQQLGWFALGGLEWNVPVDEHGYDWGTTWEAQTFREDSGIAGVELRTPDDGRLLDVAITVSLPPDMARVEVTHRVFNRSDEVLRFDYWQTAMLAPGPGNQAHGTLRFVLPNDVVSLHSSGDPLLPGPQQRFTWPVYLGRDMSRLGQWQEYLGFFEYPAAQGPFVGVYDSAVDAGAVRVFPADVVRGSKVFGLGWHNALPSEYYTDDGSTYVELHGGLSPSFFEQATLTGRGELSWQETWYPVQGIGDLAYANERTAISAVETGAGVRVGIYAVEPMRGEVVVLRGATEISRSRVVLTPVLAHDEFVPNELITGGNSTGGDESLLSVQLVDETGEVVLSYTMDS